MSKILSNAGRFALAFAAAMCAFSAQAATAASSPDTVQQRYEKERAACVDGRSHQARATCLKEAENARAEAQKNPPMPAADVLQRNALIRCESVPVGDRSACEQLAKGKGTQSGSVEGGGVIKEIVTQTSGPTVVVLPVAAPASAAR